LSEPQRYDHDVVVVGGGPAGLAAATRVRWVKGFHVLVGSVCLVESGRLGGLLSWGSCVLTGPGWAYPGQSLTERLLVDVERLSIPVVHDRVVRIDSEGALFHTHFASGRVLRSLSVILATGFRPLANEVDYYLRGVRMTFKGYDHFPSLVRSCAKDAAGRGLVVIGNAKSAHLKALIDAHSEGAGEVTLVTQERLLAVEGEGGVEAVRLAAADGTERRIACAAVLMDYNAMELRPDLQIDGVAPELDARGFIKVDASMATSVPGLFAAGDITGRYAATLMALGDGVCAGLAAYEYAFEAKFGRPPRLFAYKALDEALPVAPQDLPQIPAEAIPVSLGGQSGAPLPTWIDGQRSLADEAASRGIEPQALADALAEAVLSKRLTYHCLYQP
jgi:thioredoxin reductase (NADPH)